MNPAPQQNTSSNNNKGKISAKTVGLILLSFFILLTAGFVIFYNKTYKEVPKHLGIWGNDGHRVDTFTFINQDGKVITQDAVKGKIYVAEYFFTTCKGICPKMNDNMYKIYEAYRGNKDVMFLSHTVDPETDTVEQMKTYSRKYEADPAQWMFLTGDKKRLYDMARESYLISAKDTIDAVTIEEDFIHAPYFVLVDWNGILRGRPYDGTRKPDVDSLIQDIRILLDEKTLRQGK